MDDLIYRRVAIEAVEDTDWYHINKNGELVHGANSEEDTPLFKADDIYRVLDSVPPAPSEITLGPAIDYLHSIGWMQEHDRILTETAQQKQRWIPVSERLPENTEPVNITWVNRKPEPYYADIKDKPFTATGHYCNGKWWWYSALCQDYLDEYGECKMDEMDGDIEVIAWCELPEPYKGEEE